MIKTDADEAEEAAAAEGAKKKEGGGGEEGGEGEAAPKEEEAPEWKGNVLFTPVPSPRLFVVGLLVCVVHTPSTHSTAQDMTHTYTRRTQHSHTLAHPHHIKRTNTTNARTLGTTAVVLTGDPTATVWETRLQNLKEAVRSTPVFRAFNKAKIQMGTVRCGHCAVLCGAVRRRTKSERRGVRGQSSRTVQPGAVLPE